MPRITDFDAAGTLTGGEYIHIVQPSSTDTITATTISALASDNSFNDSAGGFAFAVDDRVLVSGFTNAVNNIAIGIITAATASKITIGGTDGDVIIDEAEGATVTISKLESLRSTAQDIADLGGGSSAYDIRLGFTSTPLANEVLDTVALPREITFPAGLAGSVGSIAVNPTASFVVSVQDDGVEIGTITISTAGAFTFATTGGTAQVVAAGSLLTFVAPDPADATAANAVMTIAGVA